MLRAFAGITASMLAILSLALLPGLAAAREARDADGCRPAPGRPADSTFEDQTRGLVLCARVPGATAAAVMPRLEVGAPTATAPAPGIELSRTLWSWLILVVMLGVLVFAPRIWRSRLARSRARIVATFVLMGWVVFVFGPHSHAGPQSQVMTGGNPVPASAEAIEAGRQLYQQHCIECHGVSGLGDGPKAATLKPPPSDLRLHMPLHPDSQIFGFVSQGFPGSAMPAFAGRLTETQLWNLVHYLRSLTQLTTQ